MHSHRRERPRVARICLQVLLAVVLGTSEARAYDWLQFGGDEAHSGANTLERSLGARNVGTLARRFTATLPATADGAPVALRGVMLPSGPADLLFVTTTAGDIVAVFAHKEGPMLAGRQIPTAPTQNIVALGQLLYSRYMFAFELAGLILLVAMIGAIVLTHRGRADTRTPKASRQLRRRPGEAIKLTEPSVGQGMTL